MSVSGPLDSVELALWRSALDTFRLGLLAGRRVLETGADPEPGRWPPTRLPSGPVPPALEVEARALLTEADELTRQLLVAMDRNRLAARRPGPKPTTSSPSSTWSVEL